MRDNTAPIWSAYLAGDASTVLKTVGAREGQGIDTATTPPIQCCLGIAGAYMCLKSMGTLFDSERQHHFNIMR